MSFHSSLDTIGESKVIYYAVVFSHGGSKAVEQGLLRHPHVSAVVQADMVTAQQQHGASLHLKSEFHCTLQFFNPARAPSETPGLASLLGSQVQVSVLYVASTPRIAAARLNFLRPQAVALACANACPHITLAVGTGAQAVWSNELLHVVEQKATTAPATRVAEWRAANVVQFNNPDAGLMPIMLTGQVCAFVQGGPQKTVSPRMMSPSTTPGRGGGVSPTESPAKRGGTNSSSGAAAAAEFEENRRPAADTEVVARGRRQSPAGRGRGGGGVAGAGAAEASAAVELPLPGASSVSAAGAPNESPMRREATAEPILKK